MNNSHYPTAIAVGHLCKDTIAILDGFPNENSSIHIEDVEIQSGGGASQAIVAFSRLEGKAGYIGVVGNDTVGDYILSELKKEFVDTTYVQRTAGESAFSFVFVNRKSASRTLFNYHERVSPIIFNSNIEEYIGHAKYLHLDGTSYDNALNAAHIAKRKHVAISLDGSSLQKDKNLNLELAKMADILIMNEIYPSILMEDENNKRALLQIAKFGAKVVISTLGEKGCLAVVNGAIQSYPSFKITPLDTTGAGDVFHGGFLKALDLNYDLDSAITFASAVSAINCLTYGGRKGIPTLKETKEFIRTNKFCF